jgi:uncharacterized membrane protein YtjA (UPF0391 family)
VDFHENALFFWCSDRLDGQRSTTAQLAPGGGRFATTSARLALLTDGAALSRQPAVPLQATRKSQQQPPFSTKKCRIDRGLPRDGFGLGMESAKSEWCKPAMFESHRKERFVNSVPRLAQPSSETCRRVDSISNSAIRGTGRNALLPWEALIMLYWTLVFLVVAIIAGALGFGAIGGMAYGAAKILFFIFIVLFILSLIGGVARRPVA